MNKDEALKLAKECGATTYTNRHYPEATAVTFSPVAWEKFCEQALAAPVQPVAWMYESVCGNDFATRHDPPDYAKNIRPLYTTPRAAQRQWVGLSQDELDAMFSNTIKGKKLVNYVARAIEAKLKEKNNG
jgi:hypothetical protein